MCLLLNFIYSLFESNDGDNDNSEIEEKESDCISKTKYTKKAQMTKCEKYFYDILTCNFSGDYDIRPQIPLSSIIEKEKNFDYEYQNELNRIIDFGIFNKNTQEPLLLIEINDKTHNQYNRKHRDKKVKMICNLAGIKLITFWTKYDNTENYIVNRIQKELK